MFWIRNTVVIAGTRPPSTASIVRHFLAWVQWAGVEERAAAASALARAFLHGGLTPSLKAEAGLGLAVLVDDPCPDVRRALAEALSCANDAPRHLVVALANDQSDVAAPLLARSRLLSDAELAERVAAGDAVAQCAISRRPGLGPAAAGALADVGGSEAAAALIGNLSACVTPGMMRRIFEQFGDDGETRGALIARPDLPLGLRAEIAIATAKALSEFAIATGWLAASRAERIAREAREAAVVSIARTCQGEERPRLARALREQGALTMAVLLRSLLGGEREFFGAALAELTGVKPVRAAAILREPNGQGFAALALKAGLPRHALTAFRAALNAIDLHGPGRGEGLKPRLIEATIAACEARSDPALEPLLSLAWRFAAEAARTEAPAMARLPPPLDFSPANDEWGTPPLAAPFGKLAAPLLIAAPPVVIGRERLLPGPIPAIEAA